MSLFQVVTLVLFFQHRLNMNKDHLDKHAIIRCYCVEEMNLHLEAKLLKNIKCLRSVGLRSRFKTKRIKHYDHKAFI